MTNRLPQTAREVHLAARPQAELTGEEFRLVEVPLTQPAPGHVVVRNDYVAVAAFLRALMEPLESAILTGFDLDRPLSSASVGTVVASNTAGVAEGDLVRHHSRWADYADATDVTVLDRAAFPDPVHHLSIDNGATALLGLRDIAGVTDGDVVLVSGAGGAVGALAGQIARKLGAARVIGTAGSADKCRWLVQDLGFDVAIDRHAPDFLAQLRRAAPQGLTVCFDLVGGAQFEAAVTVAAPHARFALGGSLDAQQGGAPWPRLDIAAAIEKDLVLRGFSPLHDVHAFTEWPPLFSRWLREGLVYPHTVVDGGVEALPQSMLGLVAGRFRGQVAVHLVAS